jgi:aspartyl-tRNA(Asn)/glutamyl-tRNA(Gln) amidotransferase subunit C
MAVTREDVTHIAALARLAIPEDRVPELVEQLNGILKHMDVLAERESAAARLMAIESPGEPFVASPPALERTGPASTPLRPDVGPPLPLAMPREQFAARTLDGAAGMRDGFYLVPRLATHEDEGGDA